MAQTSRKYSS